MHENQREASEKTEIIEMMAMMGNRMADLALTLEKTLEEVLDSKRERSLRPILVFRLFINNINFNVMPQVTSLTLTSTAPVTLSCTVVDANNNNTEIAGTLSALSFNPADAIQDIAVVDPTNPLDVDVHAVSNTGGTTVTGTGTFISTLLGTDGKTPAFNGPVTGTLVLVNNIPVKVLAPVLAFNQ